MKQLSPVYIVFWICVFLHTTKKKYTIAIYSDIACMLTKISDDEAIIYLRFYTNMQEAVGHKLFLENLDNYTLLINIKCMNPHLRDLRPFCEELFLRN